MRKRFSIITVLGVVFLVSLLSIFVPVADVFAASAIDDKYVTKDLLNCYTQRLKTEIKPDEVDATEDLLLDEWKQYNWGGKPKDEREPLGTYHTTESGNDEVGCIKLLESLGFGVNQSNAGDVLTKLGYEAQTSNGKCMTLTLQKHDGTNDKYLDYTNQPKICAGSVDSNGVIQGELLTYAAEVPDDVNDEVWAGFYLNGNEVHFQMGGGIDVMHTGSHSCGFLGLSTCYDYVTYTVGSTKWSDLVSQIDQGLKQGFDDIGNFCYSMVCKYKSYSESNGGTSAVSSYKMSSATDAFKKGYKSAFGKDYPGDATALKVTKKEQAVLYQNYLNDYYGIKADACADTKEKSTEKATDLGSTWVQTKMYGADGKAKFCYISATKNEGNGVYGVNGSNNTTGIVSNGRLNWQDLAAWLLSDGPNSVDAGSVTEPGTGGGGGSGSGNIGDGSSSDPCERDPESEECLEQRCYQEAGSMGWIICPIIFGTRNVAENIYATIEPMIQVDGTIVSQLGSNDSNIYRAWNTFRGFANILFVILFLIVIFSQLTGFGIDNYGIKKMLPKLIITAILINLSFVVCALAVDLSNIAGSAIKGLFENLPVSGTMLDGMNAVKGQSHIVGKVVGALAGGAGGLVATFSLGGWTLIIPILLFLLTTVISIIFALIVLGLRQAAVILLIVFAPFAIALYALPNTEKITKKWLDIFKGVLMVYPVVGALIGAGFFASKILLGNSPSFLMTIIAGLLCVIPYFLIPSLTRRSLEAVGNIGERLGNMGRNLGGRASNAVGNSEGVRNLRQSSADNARFRRANSRLSRGLDSLTMNAAEKYKNGGGGIRGAIARRTIASNSRLRAAQRNNDARVQNSRDTVLQGAMAAASETNRMETGGYAARAAGLESKALDETVSDYEKLIGSDNFVDAAGNSVNFQNNGEIAKALENELAMGDGSDASKARIRALTNTLAGKGKDGRDLMYSTVDNAQSRAAQEGKDISDNIKTFSSNILNNHGGAMKDNYRPIYEFAKKTAATGVSDNNKNRITDYATAGISSLTSSDMANMDIQQLTRLADNAAAGNLSPQDSQTLNRLVGEAMANEQVQKNQKTLAQFQRIQGALGTTTSTTQAGGAAQEGAEFKVNQAENAATSAQVMSNQSEIIQNVVSGNLTPAQGDRWIEITKNPTAAEQEFINRTNQKIADGTYTQEQANKLIRNMVDKSLEDNPNR
ncbi:hypothetical protein IJ798_00735 [Candidatus Saccharibacteria bacterium]|nr:hypothetical protein [Candidatus Saccharibacteria bacterium]